MRTNVERLNEERMFTNISWNNYIVVIVLSAMGWYLFVGLRFYFNDLKEIAAGKRKLKFHGFQKENYKEFESQLNTPYLPKTTATDSPSEEFDTTFTQVDALIDQLKNVIADAAKTKLVKQEFACKIKSVLLQYPLIRDSSFSGSVSEVIVLECNKLGYFILTQPEAEALWG